jgi:hypothetical protein
MSSTPTVRSAGNFRPTSGRLERSRAVPRSRPKRNFVRVASLLKAKITSFRSI